MKIPTYILGIAGVLFVAVVVLVAIKIQGANDDAKAKVRQDETSTQHSKDVQYYTDQCMSGGRWVC